MIWHQIGLNFLNNSLAVIHSSLWQVTGTDQGQVIDLEQLIESSSQPEINNVCVKFYKMCLH